jgi:hypothetical protein
MKPKLLPTSFSRRRSLAFLATLTALTAAWLFLHPQRTVSTGNLSAAQVDVPAQARSANPAPAVAPADAGQPPATAATPAVDIFAVRNWEPPQPVMNDATQAAAPPAAPPLPFRYLGKIVEPGKGVAFLLAQGDQVLSVRVGDSIDATYRVEKYEGGQLYFLYRPMKIRQSLPVGES